MEKTKRFYLKPQMEVMDVQTEGAIAASGEIEIPIDKWVLGCENSYFDNSCHANDPNISNCNFEIGWYNSCFKTGFNLNKYNWDKVTLTKKNENGNIVVYITKGWNNPKA